MEPTQSTTYTIPSEDILTDLHRIGKRHGLSVSIDDLRANPGPYGWRLSVRRPDGATVVGVACREAHELAGAVTEAWKAFLRWGIA